MSYLINLLWWKNLRDFSYRAKSQENLSLRTSQFYLGKTNKNLQHEEGKRNRGQHAQNA
jgi:hypothetical protein